MIIIKRRYLSIIIGMFAFLGIVGCSNRNKDSNKTNNSNKTTTINNVTTGKKTRVEEYISNSFENDDNRYDSLINDKSTSKTKYENIYEEETNKWIAEYIYFYSDVRNDWVLYGKEIGEDFFYLDAKWLLDYTEHDEPLWMPKTVVFYMLNLENNNFEIEGKQKSDIDFVNRIATYYYYGWNKEKNEYYYTFMWSTKFDEKGDVIEEKYYKWDLENNKWVKEED